MWVHYSEKSSLTTAEANKESSDLRHYLTTSSNFINHLTRKKKPKYYVLERLHSPMWWGQGIFFLSYMIRHILRQLLNTRWLIKEQIGAWQINTVKLKSVLKKHIIKRWLNSIKSIKMNRLLIIEFQLRKKVMPVPWRLILMMSTSKLLNLRCNSKTKGRLIH